MASHRVAREKIYTASCRWVETHQSVQRGLLSGCPSRGGSPAENEQNRLPNVTQHAISKPIADLYPSRQCHTPAPLEPAKPVRPRPAPRPMAEARLPPARPKHLEQRTPIGGRLPSSVPASPSGFSWAAALLCSPRRRPATRRATTFAAARAAPRGWSGERAGAHGSTCATSYAARPVGCTAERSVAPTVPCNASSANPLDLLVRFHLELLVVELAERALDGGFVLLARLVFHPARRIDAREVQMVDESTGLCRD